MLWCQSAKNINLNPRYRAPYDHNARPSRTDRQANMIHHGNSATIRSNQRSAL